MLPDRTIFTLKTGRFASADKVYEVSARERSRSINASASLDARRENRFAEAVYFSLLPFRKRGLPLRYASIRLRVIERWNRSSLERMLQREEFPHQIYVYNWSSASSTSLSLRKFVFSPAVENRLLQYPRARSFIYHQVTSIQCGYLRMRHFSLHLGCGAGGPRV